MPPDTWTITLATGNAGNSLPLFRRIRAMSLAAERMGVCVLSITKAGVPDARLAAIEECAAILCPECRAGFAVERDDRGGIPQWVHRRTASICWAGAIREAIAQKESEDAAEEFQSRAMLDVRSVG